MPLIDTVPCDNMHVIDDFEYAGDGHGAIVANFRCLESRVCNLIWKADYRYDALSHNVSGWGVDWTSNFSFVQAQSAAWAAYSSLVYFTSAYWSGPICLVYPDPIPAYRATASLIKRWLTQNFEPAYYTLGQTFFVYLPCYDTDPIVHNAAYRWTVGLSLDTTKISRIPVLMFESVRAGDTYVWQQVEKITQFDEQGITDLRAIERLIPDANEHDEYLGTPLPKEKCDCWGRFPGWFNCCAEADLPSPYYKLVNCTDENASCFMDGSRGQYDHYIGRLVRVNGSDDDYILTKVYPTVAPAPSLLCPSNSIAEVCEGTNCPSQCYSLTPINSAADTCSVIKSHTPGLASYVGKYVKIQEKGVSSSTCYLVAKASNCRCSVGVEIVDDDFCFRLDDCAGCADSLYVGNNMYPYIGKAVVIAGSPLKWLVSDANCPNEPDDCADNKIVVEVQQVFDFCGAPCPCPPAIAIFPPKPPTTTTTTTTYVYMAAVGPAVIQPVDEVHSFP